MSFKAVVLFHSDCLPMKYIYILVTFLILAVSSTFAQFTPRKSPAREAHEDSIITRYLKQGAWKYSYLSHEWQMYIDSALRIDSTISYLWQQKGMPLWKTRKYELASAATENAVRYDSLWIDYLGFCTCIFQKDAENALTDFSIAHRLKPGGYVMDHSYAFYESLCYLQLNKFDSALAVLKREVERCEAEKGTGWTHYLDMMYMGIAYYETGNDTEAIRWFDRALERYPRFSDVKYYKGLVLIRMNKKEEGLALLREGKKDFKEGNTINEDNAIYEPYPYQIRWQWSAIE